MDIAQRRRIEALQAFPTSSSGSTVGSARTLLRWLAAARPELLRLIRPLLASADGMDKAWWKTYLATPMKPAHKSLVLRAYLGDSTVRRVAPQAVDVDGLRRLVRFTQTHPTLRHYPYPSKSARRPHAAAGPSTATTLPSRFTVLCGGAKSRKHPAKALAYLFVVPAWSIAVKRNLLAGPFAHLPAQALSPLRSLLRDRYLQQADIRRHRTTGLRIRPTWYEWFFDTGVRALDVRNLIVYAGTVLAGDRESGRIQNALPLQLSTLGLHQRSVPDLAAALDVLKLVVEGIMDLRAVKPEDDFMQLRALFAEPVPSRDFWARALSHAPELVLNARRAHDYAKNGSKFDSGLLFHPARIVGLAPGKLAKLRRFGPYYAAVDTDRLMASLRKTVSPEVARLLRRTRTTAPELVSGIRLRGTANILMRILESREALPEAVAALPSVARFALGEPEAVYTGTRPRKGGTASDGRGNGKPVSLRKPPPLLEKLGIRL